MAEENRQIVTNQRMTITNPDGSPVVNPDQTSKSGCKGWMIVLALIALLVCIGSVVFGVWFLQNRPDQANSAESVAGVAKAYVGNCTDQQTYCEWDIGPEAEQFAIVWGKHVGWPKGNKDVSDDCVAVVLAANSWYENVRVYGAGGYNTYQLLAGELPTDEWLKDTVNSAFGCRPQTIEHWLSTVQSSPVQSIQSAEAAAVQANGVAAENPQFLSAEDAPASQPAKTYSFDVSVGSDELVIAAAYQIQTQGQTFGNPPKGCALIAMTEGQYHLDMVDGRYEKYRLPSTDRNGWINVLVAQSLATQNRYGCGLKTSDVTMFPSTFSLKNSITLAGAWNLRVEPNQNAENLGTIGAGTIVFYTNVDKGWCTVSQVDNPAFQTLFGSHAKAYFYCAGDANWVK